MSVENPINAPLRTLVDGNMDVFRYGLFKYDDSNYEDPTYLGFTVEIDESSALFTQVMPFLEKHGATRAEMDARIPVYNDFVAKIVQIFKSQESVEEPTQKGIYIKQHYINSISGLDNLTKKFNKWREDKLTIELHEDITLFSSYLAHIYNNLIYSYENGRAIIPENLLKFNLKIKISEIRNLTSIAKLKSNDPIDKQIVDGLKNNVTCIVYTLYDCEFDFFNSKPFENEIAQAGIETSTPGHSILGLDIYFKSVARNIFNPLVKNALAINDNVVDLGVVIIGASGDRNPNGQVTDGSSTSLGVNGEAYQEFTVEGSTPKRIFNFPNDVRKPSAFGTYDTETSSNPELIDDKVDLSAMAAQRQELIDYNLPLAPATYKDSFAAGSEEKLISDADLADNSALENLVNDPTKALNNLTNKIKSKVENTVKDQLHKAEQALKQKRNELVKSFIGDLEKKVGLKKIIPDNVYTNQDYYKNMLDQLKSDVGLTIGDAIVGAVTGN
jgi:hypothetical protein